jgi:hypothetical protein
MKPPDVGAPRRRAGSPSPGTGSAEPSRTPRGAYITLNKHEGSADSPSPFLGDFSEFRIET